jgi:hypothetical protein
VAECLTRKLCSETKTKNPSPAYAKQFAAAYALVKATSWELVAEAHFNGEVTALAREVDTRGPNTFSSWVQAVDEGRYADAASILGVAG